MISFSKEEVVCKCCEYEGGAQQQSQDRFSSTVVWVGGGGVGRTDLPAESQAASQAPKNDECGTQNEGETSTSEKVRYRSDRFRGQLSIHLVFYTL